MGVTISTHNGSEAKREHNRRNPRVVSKEKHIDPKGKYEIWKDEPVSKAYNRIFGSSLQAYNAKQTRPERRIKSYYAHVCKDEKKHPVYEMIIGIYGKNVDGTPICSESQGKLIMREFVKQWKERNPNLELIGAYYHADEEGEPHVHLDYIPVAHGYSRGLETQTGLVKALGEQGFSKKGKITAQILWEKRENSVLEQLCINQGLEVDHPKIEGVQHLSTDLYKLQSKKKKMISDIKILQSKEDRMSDNLATAEDKIVPRMKEIQTAISRYEDVPKKRILEFKKSYRARVQAHEELEAAKIERVQAEQQHDNNMVFLSRLNQQKKKVDEKQKKAESEFERARDLRENEEGYIIATAKNMVDKAFQKIPVERTERLEKFCNKLMLKNGNTALQEFEKLEAELQKKLEEEMEEEMDRNRVFSR